MFKSIDIGIVGAAYEAADPYQDCQRLINWFVEVSQDDKSKTPQALLGCPGLNPIISVQSQGEVRGCWVLPGGTQAVVVCGNVAVLVTMTVPATQTTIAQFSATALGTLLTNAGQVCIRDNGAGGYVVIVDGLYGYYYRIAGAGSFTFTGGVSNGSTTLTWSGSVPSQLIVGSTISDASGFIPGGTTITSINVNGGSLTLSQAATNTNASETITVTLASYGRITDPAFLGSDRISFIDGWLIFNQPGTQNLYTNAPTPYTLIFQGSFFNKIDSSTDNLITHMELNGEWWGIGERHTEVWYDAGGANFAFSRIPGVKPQIGCAAKNSIARMESSLIFLARSERGQNIVVATSQYSYVAISNKALENAIAQYPLVSDAFAYTYEDGGHAFYVLTFPTADVTWVFDGSTNLWHQRGKWDTTNGIYHRHQSNCYMNFQNIRMVGDYQSGKLHQMSRAFYTDAGNPLRCQRRSPHVWDRSGRDRVFQSSLQIEFRPGVGLQTGQGSNPQAMLRWSNDGGQTWGNEVWQTIGTAGSYKNRCKWNSIGAPRDRVYELNYSDPTIRDIVGASLFLELEEEEMA